LFQGEFTPIRGGWLNPWTKLAAIIIVLQDAKFREQSGETMLNSLKQFNVLDVVWILNR